MNFRDRNYMITSSSTEVSKGAAFLSKMQGILRGKRVPAPHAQLVAVVIRRLHSACAVCLPESRSMSVMAIFTN